MGWPYILQSDLQANIDLNPLIRGINQIGSRTRKDQARINAFNRQWRRTEACAFCSMQAVWQHIAITVTKMQFAFLIIMRCFSVCQHWNHIDPVRHTGLSIMLRGCSAGAGSDRSYYWGTNGLHNLSKISSTACQGFLTQQKFGRETWQLFKHGSNSITEQLRAVEILC